MEISVIARQALLYGHIFAFALALATILKEDLRLLRARRIDLDSLRASASLVKWLLLALWVTGVPMIMMDIGTDVSLLFSQPKLLAKLIVVIVITLNGILLHLVAFPMLADKPKNPSNAATVAAVLGAVSSTGWLYASFVGAARYVAHYMSFYDFVLLYMLVLTVGFLFAILVVRSRLRQLLTESSRHRTSVSPDQGYSRSAALLEAEMARLTAKVKHKGASERGMRRNPSFGTTAGPSLPVSERSLR